MNEGKGAMLRMAIAYKNGSIKKKLLEQVCNDHNWGFKYDKELGVLIFPKITRR